MNNAANEQALQANRETMVSLAWRAAFKKWVDADLRRVHRVWTQIRANDGRVTTLPMVAALTLEFSCNRLKARNHYLARAVDAGILVQSTDQTDARINVFSVSENAVSALNMIATWMPLIDKVIMLQRAAKPDEFDAGSDLLPPEIYMDTRSEGAKKLLNEALKMQIQKILAEKKGATT